MLNLRVSKTGEGHYTSIQEAINAVPYNTKATITIAEGIYQEKLFSDKHDISLVGEGKVYIINSDAGKEILSNGVKRGTFRSYTAFFSGEHLHLENLTLANGAGEGDAVGQAVALYLDVDKSYLKKVHLLGKQDTLFLAPLPEKEFEKNGFYGPRCFVPHKKNTTLITDSYIEGTVDFIFGGGDCLFEFCTIKSTGRGFVTAPSGAKEDIGLIFKDCSFISDSKEKEFSYLMRPWRSEGKATFISSTFEEHIHRDGLSFFNGRQEDMKSCTFAIYSCTFLGSCEIAKEHQIDQTEADKILEALRDRL